jgi:hypothetical protein
MPRTCPTLAFRLQNLSFQLPDRALHPNFLKLHDFRGKNALFWNILHFSLHKSNAFPYNLKSSKLELKQACKNAVGT